MSAPGLLRIATRRSPLALWQAEHVRQCLLDCHPGLEVELVPMTTRGDVLLETPLAKVGGKGLFVKELEQAMLDGRADLAVHSMKDVPVTFPPGLGLAAVLRREDPRDALVASGRMSLDALPEGAAVGTCSLRRQCNLRARRPDLRLIDLRGNVNSRLAKLDAGEFDAIVLAASGLMRLGFRERITQMLPVEVSLPAVGQGALGIECRLEDEFTRRLIAPLNDALTAAEVGAERAMNRTLQGGCQVPIAGYALPREGQLWLRGLVGSAVTGEAIRAEASAPLAEAESLGEQVGEQLLAMGAARFLAPLGL